MSKSIFSFKEFSINQSRCAMKVGTDGVLLGAWASVNQHPFSVLDIGAGTGVLSLMLAQRCHAEIIDALEIDSNAYEQCVDNFEQSPWSDRLFCYHASLEEFADEIEDKYDLIISNPPFYSENYQAENKQRTMARFQDAMPFQHLIESAAKLLSENGVFSVVIPYKEEGRFIKIALELNLFTNRILHVMGTPTSEKKRSLIEFSFQKSDVKFELLVIETSRHQYTEDYINLTKDFYLKM
ncbi:methyltransferase [Flavobacteriaceae bacterium GSB9]|nr:methyltransferase [Flavobacteriaceae bacterium GSB9]